MKDPQFKEGDRVRIIRPSLGIDKTAVVVEVHSSDFAPSYSLDFGSGPLLILPEFDLAAAEFDDRRSHPHRN